LIRYKVSIGLIYTAQHKLHANLEPNQTLIEHKMTVTAKYHQVSGSRRQPRQHKFVVIKEMPIQRELTSHSRFQNIFQISTKIKTRFYNLLMDHLF